MLRNAATQTYIRRVAIHQVYVLKQIEKIKHDDENLVSRLLKDIGIKSIRFI